MLNGECISIQNMVTAALKINRRGILERNRKGVDRIYAHSD